MLARVVAGLQKYAVHERDVAHGFVKTDLIVCVSATADIRGVHAIKNCFMATAVQVTSRGDTPNRPPKTIQFTAGSWRSGPSLRTPELIHSRLSECIKAIEAQPANSIVADVAELDRVDRRAAPLRPALSEKQTLAQKRKKLEKKRNVVTMVTGQRWKIAFEFPDPVKVFGNDSPGDGNDVWVGNQIGCQYKLMEPGLLNIRNNIPQFARDETYALESERDKAILKSIASPSLV